MMHFMLENVYACRRALYGLGSAISGRKPCDVSGLVSYLELWLEDSGCLTHQPQNTPMDDYLPSAELTTNQIYMQANCSISQEQL